MDTGSWRDISVVKSICCSVPSTQGVYNYPELKAQRNSCPLLTSGTRHSCCTHMYLRQNIYTHKEIFFFFSLMETGLGMQLSWPSTCLACTRPWSDPQHHTNQAVWYMPIISTFRKIRISKSSLSMQFKVSLGYIRPCLQRSGQTEMVAQQFRALTILPKDVGSVLNTHMAAYNCL